MNEWFGRQMSLFGDPFGKEWRALFLKGLKPGAATGSPMHSTIVFDSINVKCGHMWFSPAHILSSLLMLHTSCFVSQIRKDRSSIGTLMVIMPRMQPIDPSWLWWSIWMRAPRAARPRSSLRIVLSHPSRAWPSFSSMAATDWAQVIKNYY